MLQNIFYLSMEIKFCHICHHDKDWVERKTKTDYTLWNIISGALCLEMGGLTLSAGKGDVLLFHPGDTYKAWCSADHGHFLVTFFTIHIGNTVNPLSAASTAGLYHGEAIRKISDRFCEDYQAGRGNPKSPDLSLYAAFLTFFSELSGHFGTQLCFQRPAAELPDPKLTQLTRYIEKHPEKNLTVKEMAAFMGMSETYFSGFFHLHTGMTPKQYLVKHQMKYALTLLSDPSYSLQRIASCLHYADQYSFAKAFKNYYGEAPGSFRKHYISENTNKAPIP